MDNQAQQDARPETCRVPQKSESLNDDAQSLLVLSEPSDFGDPKAEDTSAPSATHPDGTVQQAPAGPLCNPSFKETSGAADDTVLEFEMQMLTLVYLRLLDSVSEFYLGSNMLATGKFDDIVAKYRTDSEQPWNTVLLQLKLKQNTNLKDTALLALKNDFSLVMYCDSYCALQSSKEDDMKFLGDFSGHQFVVFTNSQCPDHLITKGEANPVLDTGGEAVLFAPDSQVCKQLCEWVDLKLEVSRLKGLILCKSKSFAATRIKEAFPMPSKFANEAVNSTIQALLKDPTANAVEKTLQSLQVVRDSKQSFMKFLGNLRLYTGQAHDEDLGKKITQCVANTLKLSDRSESGRLAGELTGKVKAWWKESNKYLTQDSRIWLDLVMDHVDKLSAKKLGERRECSIQFTDTSVDVLHHEVPWADGGVLHVIVESRTTASAIKTKAALARFGGEERILHVGLATLSEHVDDVVGAWSSRWCRTLVVECDTELGATNAAKLSDKIIKVVEGDQANKLFVFIGRRSHGLTEALDNFKGYKCHRDSCKWDHLAPASQERLLGLEVELQGSKIALKALVDRKETFLERVDGDVISQLLRGDTRCGEVLQRADDVFVPRRLRPSDGDPFTVDSASDVDGKVVLVVASPGMGKSTLLRHNALSLKKDDPTGWIVHVSLNDCTRHLATMETEVFDENAAMKMLEKMCLDPSNSLEIALFRSSGRHLVVAVDGVDEVCPYYEKKALTLLRHLARSQVKQLWVSARKNMLHQLEAVLEVRSCVLEPFSGDDQSEFFLRAWKVAFPEAPLDKLKAYTTRLTKVLRDSLGDSDPIWGVPLMASMVAQVFEEDLRSFLAGGDYGISIRLDTLSLYETFMQKKFDLYYTEKKKIDARARQLASHIDDEESLKQTFHRNHRLAAIRFLFDPRQGATSELIGCAQSESDLADFLEEVRSGREKRGVIDNVSGDGTPHFLHRTFAEYFVASWLSENFKDHRQFVMQVTSRHQFAWISDMFNRILARGHGFHTAVLNADEEEVRCSLQEGEAHYESKDAGGRTPVHLAVLVSGTEQNLDILRLLLQHKPRVDVVDDVLGWRPLQYADNAHAWTVAGVILSNGGSEDDLASIGSIEQPTRRAFIDFTKQTPTAAPKASLMLAATRGAGLDVVRFLVEERRGDVHCRGPRGRTLLHMAAEGGDFSLLEYLCDMGLTLHAKDSDNATPLHYASRQGHTNAVDLLAKRGVPLDAVDGRGETCLLTAARLGAYDMMTLLVNNGAKFDVRVDSMLSVKQLNVALLCATFVGSLPSVQRLIARGASTSFQDGKGGTATVIAASKGYLDIVKLLVYSEANIEGDNDGDNLLHHAAHQGHVEVVSFLLRHVDDINAVNSMGETALAKACYHGHLDVVRLLVAKGASISVADKYGDTHFHHAACKGHVEVVSFLLRHVDDINAVNSVGETALAKACYYGHLDVVKLLIDEGARTSVANKYGDTLIHYAAHQGHVDVVSFLLRHVDDINAVNSAGKTALGKACYQGHLDVVKLLIDEGASTSVTSKLGDTLLHYAAEQGHVEVVTFLLDHVRDVNAENKNGDSALSLARENDHVEVMRLLTESARLAEGRAVWYVIL